MPLAAIPITPEDAIFNNHLAANLKRFSIEKPRNTASIAAVFLNQNVSTSCNLNVKNRIFRCDGYIPFTNGNAKFGVHCRGDRRSPGWPRILEHSQS